MSWPPADGKPYRPSNGTEGCCFYEAWCAHCKRDKPMREGKNFYDCDESETCQIIADTLAYDIKNTKYPKEWVWKNGAAVCTAFEHVDDPYQRITEQERAANLTLPLENV